MDVASITTADLAGELVTLRARIDRAEARWLQLLGEFDQREGWRRDGCLSAVDWLVRHCGLGRSTAKERLRVAVELRRRPAVAEALAAGQVSYSKVRAITRIVGANHDTDQSLLELARVGTARDLALAVAQWELLRQQDDPAAAAQQAWERRGVRHGRQFGGNDSLEIVAAPDVIARILAAVDAYIKTEDPEQRLPREPHTDAVPTFAQRRVDALADLIERGLQHAADGGIVDSDQAQIMVAVDYTTYLHPHAGTALLDTGTPITGATARRLACDAGIVRVITRGRSEILDVGRKTRQWPRAIRRAILFRHRHRCAYPDCPRRVVQIHHVVHWEHHGVTSVITGVPLCHGHHHLVHEAGWTLTYNHHTGVVTFTNPDQTITVQSQPLQELAA